MALIEQGTPAISAPPSGIATRLQLTPKHQQANDDGPMNIADALDALSPHHEYILIVGHSDTTIPSIVVNETFSGEVIANSPTTDDLNLEHVLDVLATTEPYETLPSLVAKAKQSPNADRAGAIATFTGRVRERESSTDTPTSYLEFEKYEGVAEQRMNALAAELEERDDVFRVLLHHRDGIVRAGEDIVFVVVLAGHREQAFETVQDGINRLKAEVPIFKKEVTDDETFWVHEQSQTR